LLRFSAKFSFSFNFKGIVIFFFNLSLDYKFYTKEIFLCIFNFKARKEKQKQLKIPWWKLKNGKTSCNT